MVILPDELQRRPGRRSWWEPKFRLWLNELFAGQFTHSVEIRNHAFVVWVSIRHVIGSGSLLDDASQVLGRLGLCERADQLYEMVAQAPEAKEQVTKAWLEQIGLPLEGICFEYVDIHSHSTSEIPLASG